jgi:hypothetical protein
MTLAASAVLLGACGGGEKAAEPTAAATSGTGGAGLADTWMALVVRDTSALAPFEAPATGDAWLSFFHNDLGAAQRGFAGPCGTGIGSWEAERAAGFPCVGLARAHLEMAELFATAGEVDRIALRQFYKHRRAHETEVLPSRHQDFFEGLVLLQSGEERGKGLLEQYANMAGADPMLAALATRVVAGIGGSDPLVASLWGPVPTAVPADAAFDALPPSELAANYRARLVVAAYVAKGDLDGALAHLRAVASDQPDVREELPLRPGESAVVAPSIPHHDPLLCRVNARFHALEARKALGTAPEAALLRYQADTYLGAVGEPPPAPALADGLAFVLFSTMPNPADLRESLRGPSGVRTRARFAAGTPALGVDPSANLADLDAFVGGSNAAKAALEGILHATPEGTAMNGDMGLSERFRARLLQERAHEFRDRFKVRMGEDLGADAGSAGVAAKSLLEFALDKNPSPPSERLKQARVSFRNDPPALVDLALANLDTRHPYDANEYIRPLTELFPDLIPVRDALAALDSAWNPAQKGSVR